MSQLIKVKTLDHFDTELGLPFYASRGAAGADVKACFADRSCLIVKPFQRVLVPTGLSLEIPSGYEVQVRPRSGLSLKTGLVIVNAPGTIDSDYRGELMILMSNFSEKKEVINHGDRVAQLVTAQVKQLEFTQTSDLTQTLRGAGGFGSTGLSENEENVQ